MVEVQDDEQKYEALKRLELAHYSFHPHAITVPNPVAKIKVQEVKGTHSLGYGKGVNAKRGSENSNNNSNLSAPIRSTDDRWAGPAAHCRDERTGSATDNNTALVGIWQGLHTDSWVDLLLNYCV